MMCECCLLYSDYSPMKIANPLLQEEFFKFIPSHLFLFPTNVSCLLFSNYEASKFIAYTTNIFFLSAPTTTLVNLDRIAAKVCQ